jgi:hypothetical protein
VLSLGSIREKIDLVTPQKLHVALSRVTFDISPEISPGTKFKLFDLESGIPRPLELAENPWAIETLGYVPESDQMPPIMAAFTDRPNVCKAYTEEGPLEQEVNCYPYPGYNAGPGGANPQLYLVWDVLDDYCSGFGEGKECFNLNWWKAFAEANPDPYDPGIFYRLMYDGIGWPIDITKRAARVLPDFPQSGLCEDGYQHIRVELYVRSSAGDIISAPSNQVAVPCPQPLGDTVNLEVNFYSLTFDNVDDGLDAGGYSDETSDAIHGYFGIDPKGQPLWIQMGYMESTGQCFTPFNVMPGALPMGCIDKGNGAFLLENEYLCAQVPYPGDPYVPWGCINDSEFRQGNNKIVVTLHDQEALHLYAYLEDYDNTSGHDVICQTEGWVGPRTLLQWAGTANEPVWLYMDDNGDASCAVEILLNALKPGT